MRYEERYLFIFVLSLKDKVYNSVFIAIAERNN